MRERASAPLVVYLNYYYALINYINQEELKGIPAPVRRPGCKLAQVEELQDGSGRVRYECVPTPDGLIRSSRRPIKAAMKVDIARAGRRGDQVRCFIVSAGILHLPSAGKDVHFLWMFWPLSVSPCGGVFENIY